MAKKKKQTEQEVALTYKQLAHARIEKRHRQLAIIAAGVIAGIVVIILLVAIINELVIKPDQSVAVADGVEISTADFQKRVRLERSQTIDVIYQYADLFGVEQVYGIVAQLDEYEVLGEQVLDGMLGEILIREAAAEMGLEVTHEEVTTFLEEQAGFYRDGTPTPLPTLTPFPSPTPITDTVVSPAPTRTPRPSPTLVTQDSYDDSYSERLRALKSDGVDEDTYLAAIEFQLLIEKVQDRLMVEVPSEADQVELDVLSFVDGSIANGYYARLEAGEPFEDLVMEARADLEDDIDTTSVPWTPYDQLVGVFNEELAGVAFSLEVGDYSQLIMTPDGQYLIIFVPGHEVRELDPSTLRTIANDRYSTWVDSLREAAELEKDDRWRGRVPQDPVVDLRALLPTPTSESEG